MATTGASRSLAATVGDNIRRCRLAAGFTQHDLAVKLGSSDAMAVSRWERGVHRPNEENLVALAELLGRDVAWFYSESSPGTERAA